MHRSWLVTKWCSPKKGKRFKIRTELPLPECCFKLHKVNFAGSPRFPIYQPFVCHLRSIPDCIAHTMRCTLEFIQDGRQVTRNDALAPYVIGVPIREITLLLEKKNRKKTYQMNFDRQGWSCLWQIVFRFHNFWITVTIQYRKR